MCLFFSCIATRDGRLLFTEEDSHETVIARAHVRDTDAHLSHFVRLERRPDSPVQLDEQETPSWFTLDDWTPRIEETFLQVTEARKPYEAACAKARKSYDAARAEAWKSYNAACVEAWKPYDATCAEVRKSYDAACAEVRKPYEATCAKAWKSCDATCAKARKSYVKALSSLNGYLPRKKV